MNSYTGRADLDTVLNIPANFIHTVVIGAGPYGLSLAAHLREKGVPFRIFGRPMQTWATQMPPGMRLQSAGSALNLPRASQPFTLSQFCGETGRPYSGAAGSVVLEDFVAYGEEFARRCVPNLEGENIKAVDRSDDLFRVTTSSGEKFFARHVVVATGLSHLQHVPAEFRHLPAARVTHPSQHRGFPEFAGRDVTVLGSGGSALHSAALLHEAGARVTLIARGRKIHVEKPYCGSEQRSWFGRALRPSSPLGNSLRSRLACALPDVLHALPAQARRLLLYKHLRPAGEAALHNRVSGFPILLGCRVHAVEAADGSCGRLRLTLTDGGGNARQHLTSHLVSATGYRIDLGRLLLLTQSLRERIRVDRRGAPKLNRQFQSTVPGLHFIGPLAAPGFGPAQRFVAGAEFAAERVSRELQRSFARDGRRAGHGASVGVLAARERAL